MQAIFATPFTSTPFTFSDEKHVENVKVCRLDQLDPLSRSSVKFEIKRIDGILNQACISDFNRKLMLMAKTG
jgi:hypothetical protein